MNTPSYAHSLVAAAIAKGQLIRGECEIGGDCAGRIDAHHDDYSRPLDVRWLCQRHHRLHHLEHGPGDGAVPDNWRRVSFYIPASVAEDFRCAVDAEDRKITVVLRRLVRDYLDARAA